MVQNKRTYAPGADVWTSVRKVIKYVLGFALCLIGVIAAFSGTLTVNRNGVMQPDRPLQYGIAGAFFLAGVLFIVAGARTRDKNSRTGRAYSGETSAYSGSIGGVPGDVAPSRDEIDRQAARKYAEDSQRQLDKLEWEADQKRIWGNE
jgi:hypothetical protein